MNCFPFDSSDSQRFSSSNAASVQSGSEVVFGVLRAVSGDRVELEADLEVEVGAPVAVRLALTPAPGTALLQAVVTRRLLVVPGESRRFLARVTEVADEDRDRCAAWLDAARAGGGTLSTFSGVSDIHAGGRNRVADALRGALADEVTVLE